MPLRIESVRAALVGVSAALRTPMWISGERLKSALEAQVDTGVPQADPELASALRVANGMVRRLSMTHTAWRNTCLYRSVAQYLVLRDFGRSAAIRIGVKGPEHEDDGNVEAHSWVLYNGPEPVQDGASSYEELKFTH